MSTCALLIPSITVRPHLQVCSMHKYPAGSLYLLVKTALMAKVKIHRLLSGCLHSLWISAIPWPSEDKPEPAPRHSVSSTGFASLFLPFSRFSCPHGSLTSQTMGTKHLVKPQIAGWLILQICFLVASTRGAYNDQVLAA